MELFADILRIVHRFIETTKKRNANKVVWKGIFIFDDYRSHTLTK